MTTTELDVLVVGAGFAGIYQLYSLRRMGYNARVIDMAGGVAGTWYWNRYPGAMSDSESFVYRYSWDRDDLKTYPWTHHYLQGPDIRNYLEHIVDKHKLRDGIQLNTELLSADWDSQQKVWRVSTNANGTFVARYLVTALGLLSTPKLPNIAGLGDFKGELCHSSRWSDSTDLTNKRVGIIGNGSTGVQIMTAIAPQVKSLVSFQRHPQYSVPSGNRPVEPEYRQWLNENYDKIMDELPKSSTCFGFTESTTPYAAVEPNKREQVFQSLWDKGNGFRFMFGGFSDIAANKEANEAACAFVKSKIAEIVKDSEKARKLMPTEAYARRPLCDGGYYQIFNRPNVDVVNLQETKIDHVEATGVKTSDGKFYELDALILATGFDAVEGSYTRTRFHGVDGASLADHWKNGPSSYLGCFVPGFPNMLMVTGPQSPFTNNPPIVETHVRLHCKLIQQADALRKGGIEAVIEAVPEAQADWSEHCNDVAYTTLFPSVPSWIFANVPGAPGPICRFYLGGLASYNRILSDIFEGGCDGFAQPLGNGRRSLRIGSSENGSVSETSSKTSLVEVAEVTPN